MQTSIYAFALLLVCNQRKVKESKGKKRVYIVAFHLLVSSYRFGSSFGSVCLLFCLTNYDYVRLLNHCFWQEEKSWSKHSSNTNTISHTMPTYRQYTQAHRNMSKRNVPPTPESKELTTKKHPGGRPPREFDMKMVLLLGQYSATYETMAQHLECSIDTIKRKMQDADSEFSLVYKKGQAKMRMALSAAQLKAALNGNPTMQIWLGRNYLGQTEHPTPGRADAGQSILYQIGKCLPHQIQFAMSKGRFTGLVGGYRSGKTHSLPWRYLFQAVHRYTQKIPMQKLTISPSFRLLQDVVIPKYCEVFDLLGVKYELRKSDHEINVLTDQFSGLIRFRSADDPTKIIAIEATDIDIDEFDTLKPDKQTEVFEKAIARLSGASDATFGITTTPEGYRKTYELFEEKQIGKLINASTEDNIYIPKEYIEMLYEQYPKLLVDQYIKGKFVNIKFDKAYYEFHRPLHVTNISIEVPFTLVGGMDFNVNPMTAVVGVFDGKVVHIIAEWYIPNANTRIMCEHIVERYPVDTYDICIMPDMTGKGRHTSAEQTDIDIIERHGMKTKGISNLTVRNRMNLVNLCFEKEKVLIDESCRYLIRDLEQVSKDKYGELDKTDASLTHISDALGYLLVNIFYNQAGTLTSAGS